MLQVEKFFFLPERVGGEILLICCSLSSKIGRFSPFGARRNQTSNIIQPEYTVKHHMIGRFCTLFVKEGGVSIAVGESVITGVYKASLWKSTCRLTFWCTSRSYRNKASAFVHIQGSSELRDANEKS